MFSSCLGKLNAHPCNQRLNPGRAAERCHLGAIPLGRADADQDEIGIRARLCLAFKPSGHIRDGVRRAVELLRVTQSPARTTKRGVLLEPKMGTDAIVIVGIGSEDLAQMGLA